MKRAKQVTSGSSSTRRVATRSAVAAPPRGRPGRPPRARRPESAAGVVDVAVVGGGVSGLYAAWRLATAGRRPVVYEESTRLGGRLYSITPPGMPGVAGDLGGMRFLSIQGVVASLVKTLGLASQPFPVTGAGNIAFVRRRLLRNSEFSDPSLVPYKLDPGEEGHAPGELLVNAIETIIPGATKISPRKWEEVKRTATFGGAPVWTWGFWNLLARVMSSEAIDLLFDAGGYESMTDNWNAAEACQYLLTDFPSNAQYLTLQSGMQALPDTLAARLAGAGATINTNSKLVGLEPPASAGQPFTLTFDHRGFPPDTVQANAVILALPQRALQILAARNRILAGAKARALLDSVMPIPAYKLLAAFPGPWWQQAQVSSGRSTTDLPVRQVYYFATVGGQPGGDPSNQNSLMLATYSDGHTESFWEPLTTGPAWMPRRNRFVDKRTVANPDPAPARLVEVARRFLAEMHGLKLEQVPEPYFAAFKDWTADPYGGGWHFWNANVRVWDVIVAVRKPFPNLPLYICGESYANQQGWVEGALCSAEHVMQDHFGLAWPSWLPPGYYIGP